MKIIQRQSGFTIIELMLATVVFTIVLLVVLGSFLQIGRLFYKGVHIARTNEISRTLVDEFAHQLKIEKGAAATAIFSAGTVSAPMPSGPNVNKPVYYFCIGTTRYTYIARHQVGAVPVTTANANVNFGLRRDILTTGTCGNPYLAATAFNNPLELLGGNMRIGHRDDISISNIGNGLFSIHLHVSYGDSDLLRDTAGRTADNPAVSAGILCTSTLGGSQFCATSTLDTAVNAFDS